MTADNETNGSLPYSNGTTKPEKQSIVRRIRQYNGLNLSLHHSDIPVLATSFVAGLTDSAAYNAWSCFVSMQTGNTIFLGLGASGQPRNKPNGWLNSLISISSYTIGCYCFGLFGRKAGPTLRGTMTFSFLIQTLCLVIATSLVEAGVVPIASAAQQEAGRVPYHYIELVPLVFLAFGAGGQIIASRALGLNEIPSIVLTSLLSDLVSDPKLFVKDNVKRNRRIASYTLVLTGAITGGWIMKVSSMATTLWCAAALKGIITIAWIFWKHDGSQPLP